MRKVATVFACVVLSGCGGGSDNPLAKPAIPTLSVTLTPSASTQSAKEADSVTSFTLNASYSGTSSDPIVPVLSFDKSLIDLDGDITQSGNTFAASFKTLSGLSAQPHSTNVTFKLCKEATCTTVYPGSTKSFTYTLDVRLSDWTTRQRNSAHNSYVHATFNPVKFAKAWQYAPSATNRFSEVAAKVGTIYATRLGTDGTSVAVALDSSTGTERWHYSLGNVNNASGPALSDNYVHFATMFLSSNNNPLVSLDASTGQFKKNLTFAAQWSTFAPPTVYNDNIYIASGYFGNVVYSWDLKTFTSSWQTDGSRGKTWDGQAPAVDTNYVYYYSGNLDVINRSTGQIVKSITDPFWQWNGYSYGGTPMIAATNNVVAYSGNDSNSFLVSYDIEKSVYRWRTASSYSIIPAAGNGVVYAASNQTSEFSAIDATTGEVKWAWPLPVGENFITNVVVTDSIAFVSTNIAVYAIDLTTHSSVWTASTPGYLAISPDAQLIVSSPTVGLITAYSLR